MAIVGAHVLLFTPEAERVRAALRDVIGWNFVETHPGWLIFALPPAELAVHPADDGAGHELYFMSDDLKADIAALGKKHIRCSEVQEVRWGSVTKIQLPSGGEVSLYQPKHPSPLARTSH